MPIIDIPDYNTQVEFPDDMPAEEIQKILEKEFPQRKPPQKTSWLENIGHSGKALLYSTMSSFSSGVSSFMKGITDVSEYVGNTLGIKEARSKIAQSSVELWAQYADYFKQKAEQEGAGIVDQIIGEAVGSAVPGIAEFLLNVPYATLKGAAEAKKQGNNELIAAIASGAERFVIGKALETTSTLKKPAKIAATSGIFATQAAAQGGGVEDIAKNAGIGALYGALGKKVHKEGEPLEAPKVKETPKELTQTIKEKTAEIKKISETSPEITAAGEVKVEPKEQKPLVEKKFELRMVKLSDEELQQLADELSMSTNRNNSKYLMKNFNPNRLETSGDVYRFIDIIADKLADQTVKGVKTLKETETQAKAHVSKIAEEMGYKVNELHSLQKSAEKMVYQLQAWKEYMLASSNKLYELYKKASSALATEADKVKFMAHLAYHSELEPLVKGVQANVARGLGANRIKWKGDTITFDEITPEMIDKNPALQAEFKQIYQRFGNVDEVIKNFGKKVKSGNDLIAANHFTREIKGSKLWNVIVEYTGSNLLSSPGTHIVNFLGNVIRIPLDLTKVYTEVAIGRMRRNQAIDNRVTLGEANARTVAMMTEAVQAFYHRPVVGIKEGLGKIPEKVRGKTFAEVLLDIIDAPEKLEEYIETSGIDPYYSKDEIYTPSHHAISSEYLGVQGIFGKAIDVFGATTRDISYGLLNAIDKPFKAIHYSGEMAAQIYREALKSGKKGKELADFVQKLTQDVIDFRDNKPLEIKNEEYFKLIQNIHNTALIAARDGTWQGELTGNWKLGQRILQNSPFLRAAFVRFYKTPINLIKYAAENSPINLLMKKVRDDLSGKNGQLAQNRAIATELLGFLTYLGFYTLVATGRVTGYHPKEKREALLAAGIPEHSIDLGDGNWIAYDRIDPYFIPLSLMADWFTVKDYIDEERYDEIPAMLMLTFGHSIFSKTWATQLGDLFSYYEDPKGYQNRIVNNQIKTLLPFSGLAGTLKGQNDPLVREAKTVMETVKRTYAPYLNRPKLDWLGEEIENHPRILMALKTDKTNWDDPIYLETARLGMTVSPPDKKEFGVELTPEEHWEVQRLVSEQFHLKDMLNTLVTSPGYKALLSDETKEQVIKQIVSSTRQAAAQAFFAKDPERMQKLMDEQLLKLKILTIPSNDIEGHIKNWREFLKPKPKYTLENTP